MFRTILSVALVLHLLVPANVAVRLLPSAWSTPVAAAAPPKVCPCTQKPGCNCCGCGSEESQDETPAPRDGAAPPRPGNAAELRCRCSADDPLQPDVDYIVHAHRSALCFFAPPPADLRTDRGARWASVAHTVDPPPPRPGA